MLEYTNLSASADCRRQGHDLYISGYKLLCSHLGGSRPSTYTSVVASRSLSRSLSATLGLSLNSSIRVRSRDLRTTVTCTPDSRVLVPTHCSHTYEVPTLFLRRWRSIIWFSLPMSQGINAANLPSADGFPLPTNTLISSLFPGQIVAGPGTLSLALIRLWLRGWLLQGPSRDADISMIGILLSQNMMWRNSSHDAPRASCRKALV